MTVTVRPGEGNHFTWWHGDLEEPSRSSASVVVRMDRPRTMRAACHPGWSYDPVSWRMEDGNWALSARPEDDGTLSVQGVISVTDPSGLNLRAPVTDVDGAVRPVVSVANIRRGDLVWVLFPDTLQVIRDGTFMGCGELLSVDPFLPGSLVSIEKNAFYSCRKLRGDLRLTNPGLTVLPYCAFWECSGLETASLPHVTEYGAWAMGACRSLESIALSDRLSILGQDAFSGCGKLRTVTPFLPTTLTKIGPTAFSGCSLLEGTVKLTPEIVSASAFSGCRNLVGAEMPNVVEVGAKAFADCQIMTNVVFSGQLAKIGNDAFVNCRNLTRVKLSEKLVALGASAFSGCDHLVEVTPFLPASLESIGANAFIRCSALRGTVALSNPALRVLPDYAFGYCSRLEGASLPMVEEVRYSAFWDCDKMTNAVLSPRLRSIGDYAFASCNSLATVKPFLPDSLETIGEHAFNDSRVKTGTLFLNNEACTNYPSYVFRNLGAGVDEVRFPRTRVFLDKVESFFGLAPGTRFYFPGLAPAPVFGNNVIKNEQWKRNILYGSLRIDPVGWRAIAQPLTENDLAAADYPGPKTFGVFVEPGSGIRHWLVDWRSPFESNGTILMVR